MDTLTGLEQSIFRNSAKGKEVHQLNLYNVQGQSCFEQHLLVDNEY
jgi:hypothetical protein